MKVDFSKITGYFNLALVILFIVFIVGILIVALRGLRRGVWKSTHNMVFMLSLVIIAFVTLDPFCKFVENFDISMFFKGSLYISKTIEGELVTYWVPITSVKETALEFVKGFYYMYNVSASASSATNFALAIVESGLKIVLFIVDIILICTLGNLFSFITWFLIFRHFIPKVARKSIKIRWLGAIETAVTFVVLTALFFTPLTSLVNSLNQSYQKNKPKTDNEMVMNIGNFVDAYNDSLFAKVLFNWTVDKDGMTIDTKLFSTFTTGISEDVSISLVSEIANLTNLVIIGANGIVSSEETQITFDAINLLTQDTVDSVFDVLTNSNLLTTILPMAADIALNSSVLDQYIPNRLIDVSDVDWKNELGYVQDMIDCLFDSGVLDKLIVTDANGKRSFRSFDGTDYLDFIEDVIFYPDFDKILNVFKSIDDSKVLTRVVPALTYFLKSTDQTGAMNQYLPLSWEELTEFSWGYECYVLFDFLHKVATLDRQFLKAILVQAGAYQPKEGETIKSLATLISEHVDDFNALIVGKFNDDGSPKDVDKYGRSIVFKDGQRIEGRNYCLFDMMLIDRVLPTIIDGLFKLDFMKDVNSDVSEDDEISYHAAVEALNNGVRLVNFKKEFNAILGIVGTVAKDAELIEALTGGGGFESLLTDPNNFFSIDSKHIKAFRDALVKMDDSSLLYSALMPFIKSLFKGDTLKDTLNDIGLSSDVFLSAIEQDTKSEDHDFFLNFASLLDSWDDLSEIYSIAGSTDSDAMMAKFKENNGALVDKLVHILTVLHSNPIINPNPQEGDWFEKNENLYGILEYIFSLTSNMGLNVTRDTLRSVESPSHTWNDEFKAVGDIIKYIASHDVLNATDLFANGLSRSAISNIKDEGEGKVGLPKLFSLVDESYIFSTSLGSFLDNMFGDVLSGFLIDKGNNVSFGNISNWTAEGEQIGKLLDSLYNLVPADDEQAKDFLSNFDMSNLKDIVELNDMLHQLSHSGIFTYVQPDGKTQYQFGSWFYQKINDSMVKFNVNSSNYDLLADPKPGEDASWTWKDSWGIKPGESVTNPDPYFVIYNDTYNKDGTLVDTHMIAYRDFVYLGGKANTDASLPSDWCDYNEFTAQQKAFLDAHENQLKRNDVPNTYLNNEWDAYFASDEFISDYNSVFELDEIGRVCKFMTYSMRVLEKRSSGPGAGTQVPFNDLPLSVLDGLLTSVNETSCLRICLYNFYRVAAENLLNGYSAFNLSSAYNAYIVDANYEMFDFAHGRAARQVELDKMISFYEVIDKAKAKGVLVGSDFDYSKMNQDGFIEDMKTAVRNFNDSYIFHRSGSGKVNSLTTFQGLFNSMLSQSSIKDVIYLGDKSPKDASSTNYNSKESKVEYLVTSTFLTDKQINDQSLVFIDERNKQFNEINGLLDCVDSLYSLKDKDGNPTTSINNADMNKADNIDIIETLFNKLNNSNILYDALPNSIYNIFVENNQFSIQSGSDTVDFKRVDPFYHYYFNDTVQRSEPDYNQKYLAKDISSIISLLTDYQQFNSQLNGKQMSDPATLKVLTGDGGALKSILLDMHNSNLFHTPARNYSGSLYYTDKFATGFTLFEEMMGKICSFVKLDTFAYDASVDDLVYGSAANKLHARVKSLTAADDTGVSTNVYHTAQGLAWSQEIDAMMHLANTAADLGSGSSLDVSSFEFDKLSPNDIKRMLNAVNASDLISDAVPRFVSEGFDAINLGTLTTYDTQNYAVYRLGQIVYGGVNADSPVGSEIDNIYQVMNSLYDEGTHTYNTNMTDLTTFVKSPAGEAGLEGLLRFVYKSHIFDTSLNGNYQEYNIVSGQKITAQGIMLYNSLGTDLSAYIARDADKTTPEKSQLEKIATLSKIVHINEYGPDSYQVETKGLKRLIDLTDGQIGANTFSDNNVETIKSKKALILGIVEASYNAYNSADPAEYKRSVFVSEFISGLFNTLLENQYTKLDTTLTTYRYISFSFGNDNADTLAISDYNELNIIERDGLNGMLDALSYIGDPMTMKTNRENIKACFIMMGENPGNNSHLAQALYLTEAHSYLKLLRNPLILNGGEMFDPVDETVADPDIANNVFSSTFSFKEYGERIDTFLSGAYIPAT